jgi:hypothetical protein
MVVVARFRLHRLALYPLAFIFDRFPCLHSRNPDGSTQLISHVHLFFIPLIYDLMVFVRYLGGSEFIYELHVPFLIGSILKSF